MIKRLAICCIKAINSIIPKGKYVSLCSNPDFSDSPQALFDYVAKNIGKSKSTYIWHIQKKENLEIVRNWIQEEYAVENIKSIVVKKYSLKSIFYYCKSRIIIDSHGLYSFKTSKQTELFLWHGMQVKKGGYLSEEDSKKEVAEADYYTVTSKLFVELFKGQFHAKESQIVIDGLPRNDYLFHPSEKTITSNKFIIFMPTFRKTNNSLAYQREDCAIKEDKLFNLTLLEWQTINNIISEMNLTIVVKPHPLESLYNLNYIENLSNVLLINDELLLRNHIPLYKLIGMSEALITDYSSVFLDYLLTEKPIAYFIPDFDEYKNNRGFVFDDIERTMAGKICRTSTDLIGFLQNYEERAINYREVKTMMHDINDDSSSKRILSDFKEMIL